MPYLLDPPLRSMTYNGIVLSEKSAVVPEEGVEGQRILWAPAFRSDTLLNHLRLQISSTPKHKIVQASAPRLERSTSSRTMPTPESASFLAAKPTVPPTFENVNYNDTSALKAAQDAIIREQWVKCMMARLVREELGKCYYREGINHLEKCGRLRGEFGDKFF